MRHFLRLFHDFATISPRAVAMLDSGGHERKLMTRNAPDYLCYLLRLWRAGSADQPHWRATLENPHTGERQVFADLVSLFAFLQEKTAESIRPSEPTPPAD